jgi:hypothetical protein
MPEKYGVSAHLLSSEGNVAVDNTTNIVFIGAAKCLDASGDYLGSANEPVYIAGEADYESKFGGKVGDGWSLSEAVEAAFRVCNLRGIWVINVNGLDDGAPLFASESEVTPAALVGSAANMSGVYAIQKLYPDHGVVANIANIPVIHETVSITKDDILAALKANVTKANGHWDGVIVYDVEESASQYNSANIVQAAAVKSAKDLSDERAIANWGHVITSMSAGTVTRAISGATVKACLYAQTDAVQDGKLPSRSIGNLYLSGVKGICIIDSGAYTAPLRLEESDATDISTNGITTWLNKGGGRYFTWGDHTSAFTNGAIADERGRFDSNMRMLFYLTNRFQMVWGDEIDDKLTLGMRNDIIHEENEHLGYCVGCGALIGEPECVFSTDNTPGTLQQGQFYFKSLATVTPPGKYFELGLAFTSEGFKVYLDNESE